VITKPPTANCLGAEGCLWIVSFLHITHLKLSPTWLGSKRLRIALVQSQDCANVLCNLKIGCAISKLALSFWILKTAQHYLEIAQIPRLHRIYAISFWVLIPALLMCREHIILLWLEFNGSLSLAKQLMLAVGDSGGTLHILEVPWTLSHPSANEVSPYPSFHYSLPSDPCAYATYFRM